MLMQQLTFPVMLAVRSGSGVIWPAALSGFTESHGVINILFRSKKSPNPRRTTRAKGP